MRSPASFTLTWNREPWILTDIAVYCCSVVCWKINAIQTFHDIHSRGASDFGQIIPPLFRYIPLYSKCNPLGKHKIRRSTSWANARFCTGDDKSSFINGGAPQITDQAHFAMRILSPIIGSLKSCPNLTSLNANAFVVKILENGLPGPMPRLPNINWRIASDLFNSRNSICRKRNTRSMVTSNKKVCINPLGEDFPYGKNGH